MGRKIRVDGTLYEAVGAVIRHPHVRGSRRLSESFDWRSDVDTYVGDWEHFEWRDNHAAYHHILGDRLIAYFDYYPRDGELGVEVAFETNDSTEMSERVFLKVSEDEITEAIEYTLMRLDAPFIAKVEEFEDRLDDGEDIRFMNRELDEFFGKVDDALDRAKRKFR